MTKPQSNRRTVVFLASENDALAGAKVGGIADVVRDLPRAMERLGWDPTIIIPSYGFIHTRNESVKLREISFPFRGRTETAEIWQAAPRPGVRKSRTRHLILHHPDIAGEPIYFNDPPERVFGRDAEKFALFCSAASMALKDALPNVVHLHDWHTGFYFPLAKLHPEFGHLAGPRTIFTIHNIGYQGSRPLASLRAFFPEIASWKGWTDSRYTDAVFTPMRAAIEHADVVTTVSPSYAAEITRPNDSAAGTFGGEGLEVPLARLSDEGRLAGILNGIDYPRNTPASNAGPGGAGSATPQDDLASVAAAELGPGHDSEALRRLGRIDEGTFVVASVSRITSQKMSLLFTDANGREDGRRSRPKGADGTAIERMLSKLAGRNAVYVLLGTGEEEYVSRLTRMAEERTELIFLNRFLAKTADALYQRGNLFLMPSSYEPCGISQLIAMRAGQPCLVHAVGGLKDTVIDGVNGFSFTGATPAERTANLIGAFERALATYFGDRRAWEKIRKAARRTRFTWGMSAVRYDELYRGWAPGTGRTEAGNGDGSLAFQEGAPYIQ